MDVKSGHQRKGHKGRAGWLAEILKAARLFSCSSNWNTSLAVVQRSLSADDGTSSRHSSLSFTVTLPLAVPSFQSKMAGLAQLSPAPLAITPLTTSNRGSALSARSSISSRWISSVLYFISNFALKKREISQFHLGRSRERCTKQYFKGLGVKIHHNHRKTYENIIPAIYLEIKCNPPT